MEFTPDGTFMMSCPDNLFSTSTRETECAPCPEGTQCNADGSTSGCSMPAQADAGDPTCQAENSFYVSSGDANSINREACRADEIKISGSCQPCPADNSCDPIAQTQTPCPSGTYSASGEMYCKSVPFGQESTGGGNTASCDSPKYFDPSTSTCQTCPADVICNELTGEQSICQATEYIDESNDPRTCETCTAGRYCEDGINFSTTTGAKMSKAGFNTPWDCPPGFECDTSSYTECAAGEFSLRETNTCTEKDYLYQSDMTGFDCPT